MADPTQLYNQTMAGYGSVQQQYKAATAGIDKGYSDLYAQQAQYGASQQLALQQHYDRAMASQQQSMLARGLGNSTVLDAGARGINYDYANSLTTLNDQLYQRQNTIKQAQLGYEGQAQQGLAGVQGQTLGFLGGYAQGAQGIQGQQQIAQLQAGAAMGQLGAQSGYQQQYQQQQYQEQQQAAQQAAQVQAAASAQQFRQQQQLQQQQFQDQWAMQQAGYDQQNYQASEYGYYAFATPRAPSFVGRLSRRERSRRSSEWSV